jgi:hypothetical protein
MVMAITPASASGGWAIQTSSNPGGSPDLNELYGVAAHPKSPAWAVGYYDDPTTAAELTLILKRTSGGWTQVPSPNPGGPPASGHDDNELYGVAETSSTNAWAVGEYNDGTDYNTVITRWNGTSWKIQTSPNPGGSAHENILYGVAATSASNAWAVGDYYDGTTKYHSLIARWNGVKWSKQTGPDPGPTFNVLKGVGATSAKNAWAVGTYNDAGGHPRTLIEHWNGVKWTKQPSPNPSSTEDELLGVAAVSASNAWTVGYYSTPTAYRTLILHWNGVKWRRVTSPNPGGSSASDQLTAIDATSSTNAWAVGWKNASSAFSTVIEHWNGTAWKVQPSPNAGTVDDELHGVAATSPASAQAGGFSDNGSQKVTLVLHCC